MTANQPTEIAADQSPAAAVKKQFPCKQCGAGLEFAPGTAALKCPYCGTENLIPQSEDDVRELDYQAALTLQLDQQPTHEQETVRCDGCGAVTTLAPDVTAGSCPFCGSHLVVSRTTEERIRPGSLLPFAVDRTKAWADFRQWISSLWLAPNDLKRYAESEGKLVGVYVPYWTYDSKATSFYRGQRGDDYWTTETYTTFESGRSVTRTRQVRRTRWTSVAGTVWNAFDDVLVLASKSLPTKYAQRLEPWDLKQLLPYTDEYLAGFRAESYQVDLQQGWGQACLFMAPIIERSVCRDIGGDHQQVSSVKTQYDHVTFKHILLPVWLSAYRYRGQVYRILINARTGEVQGERPWSVAKIMGLVVAGIALAAGILFMVAQAHGGR